MHNEIFIKKQYLAKHSDEKNRKKNEQQLESSCVPYLFESELEKFQKGKLGPCFYQQSRPTKLQNETPHYLDQFTDHLSDMKKRSLVKTNFDLNKRAQQSIKEFQNFHRNRQKMSINDLKDQWRL